MAASGAVATLASACGSQVAPTDTSQPDQATAAAIATPVIPTEFPRGELNFIDASTVDTMDIHVTRGGVTFTVLGNIYDGLKRRKHSGEIVNHLIESYENPDNVTWLFHLQQGVTFHNGEKFDARVVKFNFDRYADPATGSMHGGETFTRSFTACEVVDNYTVKWTTAKPLGPMFEYIRDSFMMMSPKAFTELGKDVATYAIGTGPFKFVEYLPGERLVMEANQDYWMGTPKLSRVVWRSIGEAASRLVELKTGRADIISQVPVEDIAALEDAENINIIRRSSDLSTYIALNCTREPFNNVLVRQALNYAIDRDSIVKYVMLGAGEPQAGFLTSAHTGYDPSLRPYPYDPDKARKLIEQAGYPNGFKFTLSGPSDRYFKDREILEAVAAQMEAIGLSVQLNIMEWATYIGEFIKKPPTFDAGMIGYGNGGTAFSAMGQSVYSVSQESGWFGYDNPEFNAKYEQAMMMFDPAERDLAVRELRQILYDDAPFIYIAAPQQLYAAHDDVRDFFPGPSGDYWFREGDGCYKA
jgi:peptide/nickel transport system substrate-binding protein